MSEGLLFGLVITLVGGLLVTLIARPMARLVTSMGNRDPELMPRAARGLIIVGWVAAAAAGVAVGLIVNSSS